MLGGARASVPSGWCSAQGRDAQGPSGAAPVSIPDDLFPQADALAADRAGPLEHAARQALASTEVIAQGEVCWASLDDPIGSGAGSRRPLVVVQGDAFNASRGSDDHGGLRLRMTTAIGG